MKEISEYLFFSLDDWGQIFTSLAVSQCERTSDCTEAYADFDPDWCCGKINTDNNLTFTRCLARRLVGFGQVNSYNFTLDANNIGEMDVSVTCETSTAVELGALLLVPAMTLMLTVM